MHAMHVQSHKLNSGSRGGNASTLRRVHSKQYRFFKKNPSVLFPCNPRRILQGFSRGCMVIFSKAYSRVPSKKRYFLECSVNPVGADNFHFHSSFFANNG